MRKGKKQKYCEYLAVLNALCIVFFLALYPRLSQVQDGTDNYNNSSILTETKTTVPELKNSLIFGNLASRGKPLVKVLIWTTFFGDAPLRALEVGGVRDKYQITDCPVHCLFSSDRSMLDVSDAVVFHGRDIKSNDLPFYHSENQTWIYLNQESPFHTPELENLPIVFNWTMTYRTDSDVYHPYGEIKRRKSSTKNSSKSTHEKDTYSENIYQYLNKTKLVAWVVSNCNTKSNRENFVEELRTLIDIDIYGGCGDFKCSKGGQNGCFNEIEKPYKFFLSFENSLCSEYVTEKFFNALSHSILPIVYGYANYSSIVPTNSYIDSRKFNSSKELANYLLHLDANPQEYLKYFEWKQYYKITHGDGWCTLCKKLQNRDPNEKKWYTNLSKWWNFKTGSNDNVYVVLNSQEENVDKLSEVEYMENSQDYDESSNLAPMCLKPPEYSRESFTLKILRKLRKWVG